MGLHSQENRLEIKKTKEILKEKQHYRKKMFLRLRQEVLGVGHFTGARNRYIGVAEYLEAKGICHAAGATYYLSYCHQEKEWY